MVFERLRRPLEERGVVSFEARIFLIALAAALPGVAGSLIFVWIEPHPRWLQLSLTATLIGFTGWVASRLRVRVARPLATLANLLSALREGDFSLRARHYPGNDALAQVVEEINAVGKTLREQRLGNVETTALLNRVIEEVDVALFAFDQEERLLLANRAAERLLSSAGEHIVGKSADELDLAEFLAGDAVRTVTQAFAGGTGRWEVRRSGFRTEGRPHSLLVISDLSQTLRREERQAWKRLIRVLGHELNNSMAPIRSMSETLVSLLRRDPLPVDWKEDMEQGLKLIGGRSEALIRFLAAYSRLARLPPPQLRRIDVAPLIRRTASLETRLPVFVEKGADVALLADGDQLEQMLINLIRNAADAALTLHGSVGVGHRVDGEMLEIRIEDEGPGLGETENLFVPFYTTKPSGTGIGLVLSRQIAEAHGGTFTLENRQDGPGCLARIRLPLVSPVAS
jgi:two-component system nitrogen regulation sensor histidine kinase NtrY